MPVCVGWIKHLFISLLGRELLPYIFGCTLALCQGNILAEPVTRAVPTLKMHVFTEVEPADILAQQRLKMIVFDQMPASNMRVIDVHDRAVYQTKPVQSTHTRVEPVPTFYWSTHLSTGYRRETMQWQVASRNGAVDPLLETRWNNLDLWQVQADLEFMLPLNMVLKGHAAYGFTYSGTAQQNLYTGQNTSAVQLNSAANSGSAADFSGALGYRFHFADRQNNIVWGQFTPLAGYTYQKQKFTMRDGVLALGGQAIPATVNNEYKTTWQGPWLGFDATFGFLAQHELFTAFGHHWVDYTAWGNGASMESSRYFEHSAHATGYTTQFGYRFKPSSRWGMSVAFDYQHWQTGAGNEVLYLPAGGVLNAPLSRVIRESFGVSAGVNVTF